MEKLPSVKDIDIKNKTVLLRTAYDVPLEPSKEILDSKRVSDDSRIIDSVPTIEYLLKNNAKIILAAGWVGRPNGEDAELTMAPAALRLQEILGENGNLKHPILMAPNCLDGSKPRSVWNNQEEVKKIISKLKNSQIVVLENVRYDKEANENNQEFAEFVASLAGKNAVYVNEAEAQNHRPEATIASVPLFMAKNGGKCCFGFKYIDVVNHIAGLSEILENTKRGHFVFFLSGKKIEFRVGITSKISVTNNFLDKMRKNDVVAVLGGVAYTFLITNEYMNVIESKSGELNKLMEAESTEEKNKKIKEIIGITEDKAKKLIGNSFAEWNQLGEQIMIASHLILKARDKKVRIILPDDHTITNQLPDKYGELQANVEIKTHPLKINIPDGWLAVAPGPKTLETVCSSVKKSSITLLAGPISIEDKRVESFSNSHKKLLAAIKEAKSRGATTIAAGGDTDAMIKRLKGEESFTTISNAGGATLELMESGTSEAIEAIKKANSV